MKELQLSSVRQNQAHKAHPVLRGKTRTAEQYAGLKKKKKITEETRTFYQNDCTSG